MIKPKAYIEVSWGGVDEDSARQAVEFGLNHMMERFDYRHIPDASIELTFEPPQHPRIGVGCLVINQGKLLMLQRAGAHGADNWAVPGGHLEHGETPEACAEREVLEETGVVVRAVRRLAYTNDFTPEWTTHYITLFMLCEYVSGEPTVTEPDKCPQVAWMLLGGVTCRELFLPLEHFLAENPGILYQLSQEPICSCEGWAGENPICPVHNPLASVPIDVPSDGITRALELQGKQFPKPHFPHYYPGDPFKNNGDSWTSNCSHGCGAYAGPSTSGGPDGIDPFGECPKHPDRTPRQ